MQDSGDCRDAVFQELHDLENQFGMMLAYARQLECEMEKHKQEAEEAKAFAHQYRDEKTRLQVLLSEQHAILAKSFDYSSKCDDLEQQTQELQGQLNREKERYEALRKNTERELRETKEESVLAADRACKQLKQQQEQLALLDKEMKAAIVVRDMRIKELGQEQEQCKEDAKRRLMDWESRMAQLEKFVRPAASCDLTLTLKDVGGKGKRSTKVESFSPRFRGSP